MSNKQQEYLQQVTDRLIKQIEENKASWQKPWKAGDYSGSNLPVNIQGKLYNGMNMLSLMSIAQEKGYQDNRWLTFNGAKELGGKVKKGEVASDIYYWKFTDTITANKKDKDGNDILDEKGKPVKLKIEVHLEKPKVFFAKVFNAEQIDGLPPRENNIKKLEEWERHEIADRILQASGVEIIHKPSERAYYSPTHDHIVLPERSQFDSADLYYATALHELGHATGHESRLNRDLSGGFGSDNYAKEELRAEIASMLIGQELQIGHDPSQHIAYLESWVKVLKNDPKEIFKAVKDADAIQEYVLSFDPQRTKEVKIDSQDQSVIKSLEENHNSIKAEHQDLTTPLETYKNIEQFVNTFESADYKVTANKIDGGYLINYFEAGRKTDITTEIGGMDGKALTSFKGERVAGSYYTSDHLQQQTDLITALGQDIAEQKQLVQQAKEQIADLKVFINVPFKDKDEAKALGAKWDKQNQSWFTYSQHLDKFSKWLEPEAGKVEIQKENINLDHVKVELTADSKKVVMENRNNDENYDKTYFDDVLISELNINVRVKNDRLMINAYPAYDDESGKFKGYEVVIEDANRDDDYSAKEALNKVGLDTSIDFTKIYSENEIKEIYQSLLDKTAFQDLNKATQLETKQAFIQADRTYLYVAPIEKDQVKALGGRYDKDLQVWYTNNQDTSKFEQWLHRPSVPSPEEEFSKFLKERNIVVESGHPIINGKAHRLANEKSDQKNVMYQVYPNHDTGIPSGRLTNFSKDGGVPKKWTYPLEYVQKEQMIERVDRAKYGADYKIPEQKKAVHTHTETASQNIEKDQDRQQIFDRTAARVQALFKICPLAEPNETYLDIKGVTGNGLARVIPTSSALGALEPEFKDDILIADNWRQAKAMRDNNPDDKMIVQAGSLVIPQFDRYGELRSFETIGYQGAKYALKDGEKDGLSLQLGEIENGKPFLITEGYADGATLHEKAQSNRIPTVVGFGKNGLLAVALDYHERYPASKIYIAADNDHENELKDHIEINTGIQNAVEAAKAVKGQALIPEFSRLDKGQKDWSDIYLANGVKGLNGLQEQLKNCLANKNHSYVDYGNKAALQFGNIENGKPFLVASNYLVAKTLNEQTEKPVILLFEKTEKLIDSIQQLRDQYPDSKIYFTSDKHQEAAKAINGYVLSPDQKNKDWYDVMIDHGSIELKNQLKSQLNKIVVSEMGKIEIDFSSLKLEQQKPLRNFVIGLEEKLKDNPIKLNQALTMVQTKIPEIANGKINIAEALSLFKESQNQERDIAR